MDINDTYSTISEEEFNELILSKNGRLFLVNFTAEWLGDGTMMDDIIGRVSGQFEGEVGFFRIDIEASKNLSLRYDLRRLPAIYIFRDGEILDHFGGIMPRHKIIERLNQLR